MTPAEFEAAREAFGRILDNANTWAKADEDCVNDALTAAEQQIAQLRESVTISETENDKLASRVDVSRKEIAELREENERLKQEILTLIRPAANKTLKSEASK